MSGLDFDNARRAAMARVAVDAFTEVTGEHSEPLDCRISDLATNLLHLAAAEGIDVETVIHRMRRDFEEETVEEEIST